MKWLIAVLVLASCGQSTPPAPPVTVTEPKPTTLLLFGAGFCQDCKRDFPKIHEGLERLSEKAKGHLSVNLYYVAGYHPSETPTQGAADQYAKLYFPTAIPLPDPKWAMYKNVMEPGAKLMVPAAVIVDRSTGEIVKRFKAGSTSFVPAEIVAAVRARVGE